MVWSLAARLGLPAARAGLRWASKLKKPKVDKGLTTLFRGEPVPTRHELSLKDVAKHMYRKDSMFFKNSPLRKGAAGRWFSTKPSDVTGYAGNKVYSWKPKDWANIINWGGGYKKGVVKKLKLTKKELKLAKRLQKKVTGHDMQNFYIVPKNTLPRVEKDSVLTAIANLKNMLGIYKHGGIVNHGGLARILEV
jgi:hypothetical protein